MKLIIAGGRDIEWTTEQVHRAVTVMVSNFRNHSFLTPIVEVVSGGARGIDAAGEAWAAKHRVPVRRFQADWKTHGRAAGPIRNKQMAEYADVLLLIWDGKSPGSRSMRNEMLAQYKPVLQIVRNDKGEWNVKAEPNS